MVSYVREKDDVTTTEWIYERNPDNSPRFVLGTTGENPLVCFGITRALPNRASSTAPCRPLSASLFVTASTAGSC